MARLQKTWWQRNKYLFNALILILPCIYIYQAWNPTFPDLWQEQTIGEFKIAPMPLNMDQPYSHHNEYVKDFFLAFNQGEISKIRQAYLNIGPQPLPLSELAKGDEGIMHGTNHGQHAHAIASSTINKGDKLWVTIQTWQGEQLVQHWSIPSQLIQH